MFLEHGRGHSLPVLQTMQKKGVQYKEDVKAAGVKGKKVLRGGSWQPVTLFTSSVAWPWALLFSRCMMTPTCQTRFTWVIRF